MTGPITTVRLMGAKLHTYLRVLQASFVRVVCSPIKNTTKTAIDSDDTTRSLNEAIK